MKTDDLKQNEQCAIHDVSNSAFYKLADEFSQWNRRWELFEKQEIIKKPPHLDEFITEMEKKFVVGFKHCC